MFYYVSISILDTSLCLIFPYYISRPKNDGSLDCSDREEEFYYTEVEVSVDTVMQTFADMHTSSPTQPSYMTSDGHRQPAPPFDHDYQRKVRLVETRFGTDLSF